MNTLHGSLETLIWESQFFGIACAVLHMSDNAPSLYEDDLKVWKRIQAKIPADRLDWLDTLQRNHFQFVGGEVEFIIKTKEHLAEGVEIATEEDIDELRHLAVNAFRLSRFRMPWYSERDRKRFYAQWIENAVKGNFDHQCLVFRTKKKSIKSFVSLRQLNDREARIGLLVGRGMGERLIESALYWTKERQLSILRIVTQIGNIAALRRYIASGANVKTTAYWLYR